MTPLPINNSWVLVTGASTGLGRASALRLAESYQAKPLIVGRRLDSLLQLQAEIGERFDVACEIVVADQRENEGRKKIAAKVADLEVNAALLAAGLTSVGSFDVDRAAAYAEVIETNILGFTDLLARLVTIFRQRPSETSIIAVSSLGGETSVPFQAVYGASKAYVSTLVRGVSAELAGTGVSVGSFVPGGIDTGMAALSDLRWGKMGLMDVDRCAAHAVKALIYRQPFTIPGLSNRLTYMASRALPRSLVSRIAALPYRQPQ
ncbi:SDR family NAD(P)-dependent oxidoreductase [Sphingobium yanoikuyae]|mgnify:CR=1 FL=1|jgi:short-subunit dehydrogenase|uniref:SDR family NAD(P)-dependent oxidoreductase n=1 Tax=Sphingobium yanoikuyae TaxID=13690 RepID=A0AA42WS73_SPHYA|nr:MULTISPECIES: SDR family NAD(P)-dependent oxidoreductase [Sphingobium]MBV2150296.1 SDR family NAD(P)-dependent oxidoreductase [Sphingobium sp. AS12]MDH2129626.1 SDR family NAD(P)-dependent oxidoreductase [Sphingobium yanoikuyae]MDH2149720.1 SDR family NAD(P)-dependent oxidoreductase [Sphingobium yanoikuyae]MDH2165455.1 SDR family NAD(P)-dependent oxidoreductase [Sphingobium yanoikuyae]QWT14232.1 SDR family NAD(P)-dependent oxidoreductase [Sphingobium xenophagum]|tara:strand:- start:13189 stop:13977 length:789 start_codon:yes stop_codon:yes gene_type:complete